MAFSKLVQAFADVWSDTKGLFADNEFENVNAKTFRDFTTANAALHDRGPNAQRGLLKRFRYLTKAEVVAGGGLGEAFEELDYDTCCVGTQVVIDYYQPDPAGSVVRGQVLVAAYDATGAQYVYSDGSFRAGDRVAAAQFVPLGAAAAAYGYVRRDAVPASIKNWQVGELSIWELNGADEFATAKQVGGPWPAFTGVDDAYWKPAAAPVVPDAYTRAQADALYATKQPALIELIHRSYYANPGTVNYAVTMDATDLNQSLEIALLQDTALTLPTLDTTNTPAALWLKNNSSPGKNGELWQLKLQGQSVANSQGSAGGIGTLFPGQSVELRGVKIELYYPQTGYAYAWMVSREPAGAATSSGTVKTVNGQAPDAAGNVQVAAGSGGSVTAADLDAVRTTLTLRPARTADDTLALADIGALVPVAGTNAVTLTVPTGLGLAAPYGISRVCYPLQQGSGTLTLLAASGVNLLPAPGGGLRTGGQGARLVLIWLDTNTVLVEGGVV